MGGAAPPPELGWEENKKGERIRGGGGNGGRKNGEQKSFWAEVRKRGGWGWGNLLQQVLLHTRKKRGEGNVPTEKERKKRGMGRRKKVLCVVRTCKEDGGGGREGKKR